ncbi:MAG: hypothetical protein ACPGR8_17250, partial [Limisphaerales bacterium]
MDHLPTELLRVMVNYLPVRAAVSFSLTCRSFADTCANQIVLEEVHINASKANDILGASILRARFKGVRRVVVFLAHTPLPNPAQLPVPWQYVKVSAGGTISAGQLAAVAGRATELETWGCLLKSA